MNQRTEEALLEKLKQLPPERIAQVEDFVNFLASQERRREAIGRLQALQAKLPPGEITDADMQMIVDEVKAYRAEKRDERERAGRP